MTFNSKLNPRFRLFRLQIMMKVFLVLGMTAFTPSLAHAQWSTNGTNINNTNSGNVGVGTTAPSTKVEVVGNINAKLAIDAPATSHVRHIFNGAGAWLGQDDTNGELNFGHNLYYNYGFKYRVTGTAANIRMYEGALQFQTAGTGSANAAISWTDRMVISANGNVGIASTNPLGQLHLGYTAQVAAPKTWTASSSNGRGVVIDSYKENAAPFKQFVDFAAMGDQNATQGGSVIRFLTNPVNSYTLAERMRIDNAGNVGVGTNAPSTKLHIVAGTDTYTNLLNLDTGVHLGTLFGVGGTANNESVFGLSVYRGGQYFTRMYVDQFGRVSLQPNGDAHVGIGTSNPNYRLDVQGGQLNASGGLCIAGDCKTAWSQVGGGSQWTPGTNSISYSGGNVGIGTTTPQRSLDLGTSGQVTFGNNGYNSTGSPGIFWYTDNANYGIHKTAGSWSAPNYQQLKLAWDTGIIIDGGSAHGKSGLVLQPSGGNVGIGTTAPSTKLHVLGDVNVTGTGNITAAGTITAGNIVAKYQDVAEWVPATHALPAGTVVTLDPTKSNHVEASSKSYDTRVAGVISEQPGIALGERGDDKLLVATTGRVRLKVDASSSPIQVGDLLVTSNMPGLAMKSEAINVGGVQIHRPGTIIGKALEPLAKGRGEILVLLSLQ